MNYNRTNWLDAVVQYPDRYKEDIISGGINLTRYMGNITQLQTEVTAERMNNIENALVDADDSAFYKTISGNGNNITCLFNTKLINGHIVRFIANENNNGLNTTLNGIPIYRINSTIPPVILAGMKVTLGYNEPRNCFFFQYSSEGDASPNHVFQDYTFSNSDNINMMGTMPYLGHIDYTIPNAGGRYTMGVGYTDGGIVKAPSLATMTNQGTVTNSTDIFRGYKGYSNGVLYNGTNDLNSNIIAGKTTIDYEGNATINNITGTPYIAFFWMGDFHNLGFDGYNALYEIVYDPNLVYIPLISRGTQNTRTYTHYSKFYDYGSESDCRQYHYYDERISFDDGTLTIRGFDLPNAANQILTYMIFKAY